jgi:hypothetical protein
LAYEITADCPKKIAHNMNDPCGARCPDLPKVLQLRNVAQRLQSLKDASTPTKADQDILLMIFGSGPPLAFAVQKRPKKNLSPPNGA